MTPRCYFIATSWKESAVSHHFRALAHELARRGHRVVLLVDGQRHEVEDRDGNPLVHFWPSPRPTRLRDARFLRGLIRTHRPDCVVANFGAGNLMTLVGRMMAVPCRVVWYHTLSTQIDLDASTSRWMVRLQRWRKWTVYQSATHVVANSEAARADLQRVYRVPSRRSRVFYNSLADPLARPSVTPAAQRRGLVCTGRLFPTKGQDVLIRAVALMRDASPDVRVDIIGDGPSRPACVQLARDLGIEDCCIFTGALPHEEVLARMAAATATVVPSRSEAFGLVNIESLAVRTPVVASGVGGIAEIIRDGVDGFLVPPDDPAALAEKLRMLLSQPALAARMGGNARQGFLAKFEQTGSVREQAEWLETIVATTRHAPTHGLEE